MDDKKQFYRLQYFFCCTRPAWMKRNTQSLVPMILSTVSGMRSNKSLLDKNYTCHF